MKLVLPALARPLLEPHMPAGLDLTWFASADEANAAMPDADIAWIDQQDSVATGETAALGVKLKWLSTIRAGLDAFDLPLLAERGTIVTNGAGVNAVAVAEYAVMGVLAAAKRYDEVVRMADKHEWTHNAPGQIELLDTSALIIGMGTIGAFIAERLRGFGVEVVGVTRLGRDGTLTPDAWRARLGEFDWVILGAPSTDETKAMIGADELTAMKSSAWLINIARGDMIDQEALITALKARRIAGAFLDPTDPEPLPADHPLWDAPNTLITMHLSGRSQTKMFQRSAALFVENLAAFLVGNKMRNVVDLQAGY